MMLLLLLLLLLSSLSSSSRGLPAAAATEAIWLLSLSHGHLGLVAEHRLGRCRRHRDAAAVADVTVVAAVDLLLFFCCRAQRPLATGQPPSLAAT